MGKDVNIDSTGQLADDERMKQQQARMDEIAAKKAADAKTAQAKASEEGKAKAELAEEAAEAAAKKATKAVSGNGTVEKAVVAAAGTAATELVSDVAKGKVKIKGGKLVLIVVALVVVAALVWFLWPKGSEDATTSTQLTNSGITTTQVDFNNAVLGEARQKQDLVVHEQDVTVDTELSSTIANMDIFKKTKTIHSSGVGVYTVDMSAITEDSITVDSDAHTVTIAIPHTRLNYIAKDLQATTFEETDHSLLSFGDLKLAEEQSNAVDVSIEDAMREQLTSSDAYAKADADALLMVYDTYNPVVQKVDDSYVVEVVFDDSTTNEDISFGATDPRS